MANINRMAGLFPDCCSFRVRDTNYRALFLKLELKIRSPQKHTRPPPTYTQAGKGRENEGKKRKVTDNISDNKRTQFI